MKPLKKFPLILSKSFLFNFERRIAKLMLRRARFSIIYNFKSTLFDRWILQQIFVRSRKNSFKRKSNHFSKMFDHFYDTLGYHNNIMASQKQT